MTQQDHSYDLIEPAQAHKAFSHAWLWTKAMLMAGHRLRLDVTEAPKSRPQEERYHAMIADIAAQVSLIPGRERESREDAKRLLVSAFREDTKGDAALAEYWRVFGHYTLAPGLRGELVPLGTQTRKFKRPLAAAFITWLEAFGAEHGVAFHDEAPPEPIESPKRDEAYRRRVAELPCINCGAPGPSQCAHANSQRWGKGMGIKADDSATFPLCPDCHRAFDQGGMFTKEAAREIEAKWIAQTRKRLEYQEPISTQGKHL